MVGSTPAGGNGPGCLADELADAWDEDGDGDGDESMDQYRDESQFDGYVRPSKDHQHQDCQSFSQPGEEDAGSSLWSYRRRSTASDQRSPTTGPAPSRYHRRPAQHRQRSKADDGRYSDEDETDLAHNPNDLSPSMESLIAEIQILAQEGSQSFDGGADDDADAHIVERFIHGLRDLGAQANIEDGTSRLVTTHMNLANQTAQHTRTLYSLSYPLLFSFSPSYGPSLAAAAAAAVDAPTPAMVLAEERHDDEDDLGSLLEQTSRFIPSPADVSTRLHSPPPYDLDSSFPPHSHQRQSSDSHQATPLSSLTHLSTISTSLVSSLSSISDTIHMSRQTTSLASRTLKAAHAMVAEITREQAMVEQSIDRIEKGQWQARLERRECQEICAEVLRGFEEGCRKVEEWWQEQFGTASSLGMGVETGGAADAGADESADREEDDVTSSASSSSPSYSSSNVVGPSTPATVVTTSTTDNSGRRRSRNSIVDVTPCISSPLSPAFYASSS